MIHTMNIVVPAAAMNAIEIAAVNEKCEPDGRPHEIGIRTEVKGPFGPSEEFFLTFRHERNEPAVAMIGMLHQCCMDRWGPGQLDVTNGMFVWLIGNVKSLPNFGN